MTNQATLVTPVQPIRSVKNGRPWPLRVRSCGMTDRGRVRRNNEDHFLVAELSKALRVQQSSLAQPQTQFSFEQGHLFLVADGMGGTKPAGRPAPWPRERSRPLPSLRSNGF